MAPVPFLTWCCVSWPGLGVLTEAWMWDGLWAYYSPWFGVFFVFALKLHAVWSYMLYIVGTQMIYWARFVSFRCSQCIRLEGLFNLSRNNNSKRVLLLVSVFDVMPWNGSSMQGPRMVVVRQKNSARGPSMDKGLEWLLRTIAPEGVTPFVHGVTSSVQGVIIEQ